MQEFVEKALLRNRTRPVIKKEPEDKEESVKDLIMISVLKIRPVHISPITKRRVFP